METAYSYRIVYDVHCHFENFFGKETIVKNCYSEAHAKYKLGAYCEKKYGAEFEFITFKKITKETPDIDPGMFNTLFGSDTFGGDVFSNIFNKKKK